MEDVVCTGCLAEPADQKDLTGWVEGEYGWQCPSCLSQLPPADDSSAGLDAVAAALGATKKERKP